MTPQRTLIFMRHAEAVDSHKRGNLFRSLTPNGHRQAFEAASLLKKFGAIPQQALISTAVRTEETFQDMKDVWETSPHIIRDERLFNVSHGLPPYEGEFDLVTSFNEILTQIEPDVSCVLVLGHNPAIANLVHKVTAALPYELTINYPTATAVILDMKENNWDSLASRHCTCSAVIYGGTKLIRVPDQTPSALRAPEAK